MESPQLDPQGAPGGASQLPDDFYRRVATKIVVTGERERDSDEALVKISSLIIRNLSQPDRLRIFIDTMDFLLEDEESQRYAALSYVSISIDSHNNKKHEKVLNDIVDVLIDDHIHIVKPEITLEHNKRKHFSHYSKHLGNCFVNMIEMNSDLYEMISLIYSLIIRKEMVIEQAKKDGRDTGRKFSSTKDSPKAAKKLFDEIVDFIHARGEFRSDSLNQQNPNEFMAILADRLRGTRRYVIQDIINRQALSKKKEMEKELSERLANAEDIIVAKDAFQNALNLFWTEKLYNFKFLSVEKVRVTVQVMAIVLGILYFLGGYLGIFGMKWWEGVVISVGMYIFGRVFCSRRAFKNFFPEDVSKELEIVVGSFTSTLRRMSKEQMDQFLVRQVKDPANLELLPILPEFVKYLFAVMPDRKSAIITLDELGEIMENMELDIARTVRNAKARL